MVDQVADGVETNQTCPACGAGRNGRYCHACGQDSEAKPRPLREWAAEAFSEANLIDGRTARTLAVLAVRPGRYLQAWRVGAGSRYQSPTKLFVVMTALFLLVLNFTGVSLTQFVARPIDPSEPVTARLEPDGVTVRYTNVEEHEFWLQPTVDVAIDPAVTAAIQAEADRATTDAARTALQYENHINAEQAIIADRLTTWLPNVVWLLMPAYALLLAPIFGRRRLLMEHLVFALWAHVTGFALLILLVLANRWGAGLPGWLVTIPFLIYVTVAAKAYYALSWRQAVWRAPAHFFAYGALALTPATIGVYVAAMDREAFVAFLAA